MWISSPSLSARNYISRVSWTAAVSIFLKLALCSISTFKFHLQRYHFLILCGIFIFIGQFPLSVFFCFYKMIHYQETEKLQIHALLSVHEPNNRCEVTNHQQNLKKRGVVSHWLWCSSVFMWWFVDWKTSSKDCTLHLYS